MTNYPYKRKIIIIADDCEESVLQAKEIEEQFGDSLVCGYSNKNSYENSIIIFIEKKGISIKLSENNSENPVFIDFSSTKTQYRKQNSGTRKESIARAVGLKSGASPLIIDATAGLGSDSFILAALGAKIIMLERNQLIHLLLKDALMRANNNDNISAITKKYGTY